MAKANKCRVCGSTSGPWAGSKHSLCEACIPERERQKDEAFTEAQLEKYARMEKVRAALGRDEAAQAWKKPLENPAPAQYHGPGPRDLMLTAMATAALHSHPAHRLHRRKKGGNL